VKLFSRALMAALEKFSLAMPLHQEDLFAQLPSPSKHFSLVIKVMVEALGPLLWGYEVYGRENLQEVPDGQGCILASNHTSYLDAAFVGSALPFDWLGRSSFLSKIELFRNEIMYPIMRMAGGIPVDRGGRTDLAVSIANQFLRVGGFVVIFPEGTIPDDKGELRFRRGVGRMAFDANVPVVPIHIVGGFDLLQEGSPMPRIFVSEVGTRCNVKIVIGKPIYPPELEGGISEEERLACIDAFTQEVEQRVRSLTPENCLDSPSFDSSDEGTLQAA
jgi:1-acyl-sn-glycerol-3-phosphate acyltransferase